MKSPTRALVVLLTVVSVVPSSFAAQSLENLIKEADVASVKRPDGSYKIPVTVQQKTVNVFVFEEHLGNSKVKTVGVFADIATLPPNYKMPQALLDKIFALNCQFDFGRIVREGDELFYRSYFLLDSANAESFQIELSLANMLQQEFQQQLVPLITK